MRSIQSIPWSSKAPPIARSNPSVRFRCCARRAGRFCSRRALCCSTSPNAPASCYPGTPDDRALAKCWLFAALNSVEPFLAEVTTADIFIEDKQVAKGYRSYAVKLAEERLGQLSAALGDREWLAGDAFTLADLMMSSVTKVVSHTDLVERHANLAAWRDRCFARPAYTAAIAEQCAEFEGHGPGDMGWGEEMTTKGERQ